jgi:hypothetical protein
MYLTGQAKMSIQNKILIVLIILMMGTSSVFFYLIYQDKKAITQKPEITTEKKSEVQKFEKTYPEDLTGKVYLTLKEKDSDKQGIYYFDMSEKELVEVYVSEECKIIGGGLNSSGSKMTYSSNCEQDGQDYYQTFLLDLNTKDREILNEKKGDVEDGAKLILNETERVNFLQNETISSLEFSPNHDGYIIAKKINQNENKSKLVLYDIETKGSYSVFSFDKYESDQILINDWR